LFGLWLVLLIITIYHWLLRYTTFLQPNGGGHECTRPTSIQLATMLAHKTTNAMYTTDTSVTSIDLTCD